VGNMRGWAHMSKASPSAWSPVRARARRLLVLLGQPYIRIRRALIIRRSAKGSIDTARSWRRRRFGVTIGELFSYLGAIALGVVVVWSVVVMLGGPGILTSLNNRCGKDSAACGVAVGILIPLLLVAAASAVFLFYRLRHVTSPVVKKARRSPQDLVETATPNTHNIVGRNELCQVMMEDIRHRDIRRPHMVVGGVGTGKTAVLVRLTELLAKHKAMPVPIKLRDAEKQLDFRDMAYKRFQRMAEGRLFAGEAEKVWNQLCRDDKVVVIADGLEEALTRGSVQPDRDNLIRLAIHRAREARLPLIIASRPHEPLRGADATIMELEPLSEDAALEYIAGDSNSIDARWLDWIVETAGLTELPLYLRITRQLVQRERLDYLSADGSARTVDLRNMDRSQLRLHLLDLWLDALFEGHLMAAVPLNRKEREAAVEWLSALACIGLKADALEVKFGDYYEGEQTDKREVSQSPRYGEIDANIRRFADSILSPRHLDIRLAANWGDQLQLVEAYGDGLRFRHSIMQAYLGSRFMSTALRDEEFRKDAEIQLRNPGREFLIALVLYSRSGRKEDEGNNPVGQSGPSASGPGASGTPRASRGGREPSGSNTAGARTANATAAAAVKPAPARVPANGQAAARARPSTRTTQATTASALGSDVKSIRDALMKAVAEATNDVKKLDLYAAALEIDSFLKEARHQKIAKMVASSWRDIRGGDQRTLDEAKLGLVRRFSEAARTIADHPGGNKSSVKPAYQELLKIGCCEPSYPIRLAVAQEIGAGSDGAFEVLRGTSNNSNLWEKIAWPDKVPNAERGKKPSEHERNGTQNTDKDNQPGNVDGNSTLPGRTLCAWVTPLLVGSVGRCREEAREELGRWLAHVGRDDLGGEDYFHISLEVALAQGFKYAANRRVRHPHALPETRFYLAEQAMEMLRKARFWFSQLILIHALCLWEMPDPEEPRDDKAGTRFNGESSAEHRTQLHGSTPKAIVGRWLRAAKDRQHPFVAEAGKLAVQALKTGQPERFLWIDESGIVSSVGSRATHATSYRKHHLWIPPSAGWAALDPRAQQLVADVLLVLNLAERGQAAGAIELRLRRVGGTDLPPCLTQDRDRLDPGRTVGGLYTAPGSNCMPGCHFRLCPYPPRGEQPYRSELSEAFCRGQQTLVNRRFIAPWQTSPRSDLKHFWEHMADRARGSKADQDRD
jgi:hypothetical protein